MKNRMVWIATSLWLCSRAGSFALDILPLSGFEADTHRQGFGFAGFAMNHPISAKAHLAAHAMGSYLYYRFPAGSQTVRAEAPGAHCLAGFRYAMGPNNYWTILGGAVSRRHTFTGGPGLERRGDTGATAQAEVNLRNSTGHTFNATGVYNAKDSYKWSRFTVKKQIGGLDDHRPWTLQPGVVATFQGNYQHRARAAGALLELYCIPSKFSAAVQAGYKWDSNWKGGGYGGIGLSKQF